jgi:chromosome segregation ATPase
VEDLDARAITLTTQREQITRRIDDLPQARRRLERQQDPHSVERAHLTGALQAADRELDAVLSQRERLARELGNPSEVRAERDGLQRALTQLTRERTAIRDELAEREVHAPGAWAARQFGETPDEPRLRREWEQGVRHVARYRLQYDVTDPDDPLGTQPEPREQQRDLQRAREALDRSARRLGRDVNEDHDLAIEISP